MLNVNLNNPIEVRTIGMQALKEALGPVGVVRFIQQFDLGHGNYTEERHNNLEIGLDEIDALLKS